MRGIMPTVDVTRAPGHRGLHWGRIVGGAILLEVVLVVVLIPIGLWFGMPGGNNGDDFTVFFTSVAIGCFAGGYLVTAWMLRPIVTRRLLHGTLLGVVATLMYIALNAAAPDGLGGVVAGYGVALYVLVNALRISGCVLAGNMPARTRL